MDVHVRCCMVGWVRSCVSLRKKWQNEYGLAESRVLVTMVMVLVLVLVVVMLLPLLLQVFMLLV